MTSSSPVNVEKLEQILLFYIHYIFQHKFGHCNEPIFQPFIYFFPDSRWFDFILYIQRTLDSITNIQSKTFVTILVVDTY
ncbi:MAG: hypothetical protein DLM72_11985 [Candidatus Nitrosopolaris wilkensis]|nr:MAG: hypothetical protein DLM72_11985 [Candidatus Nitrosopolaris wilkensis]